jgi:hypothetical protein
LRCIDSLANSGEDRYLPCDPLFRLKYFFSWLRGELPSSPPDKDGDRSSSLSSSSSIYSCLSFSFYSLLISSSGMAVWATESNLVPVADKSTPW